MGQTLFDDLQNVLKHFTLEELNTNAINQIQDINWDDVVKQHTKHKKPFNRTNIIKTIVEEIRKLKLDFDVLDEIVENLKLLAMALSKTKTWQTYKLLNQNSRVPLSLAELNTRLERKFRQIGQETEIHSIDHDGKFVISIKIFLKRTKKSLETRTTLPIYIIFQHSSDFIFTSKMLSQENFNSALVKSLGYQNLKLVKLRGTDPNELLKILLQKDDNLDRINFKEPEFVPKIKTTDSGIDCTTSNEKREYVDQVFNEDLTLQTMTFNVHNVSCKSERLRGEKMSAVLQIQAPNIKEMIKDLADIGAIDVPFPDYLTGIFKKGRNTFEIGNPSKN